MTFCFKLDKTTTETYELLLRVYENAAVSRNTVYKCCEHVRRRSQIAKDEKQLCVCRLRHRV